MRSSLAVCVIGITMLYLVSTVKPEPVSCDPDPHGNKTCGANECCFMEPLKENEEPWGKKGICKDKIEMGNGTKRSKCSPLPKGLHGPGGPVGPRRHGGHEGTGGQREFQEKTVHVERGGPERQQGSGGEWESRGPPPGGHPPRGPPHGGHPPRGPPHGGHPPRGPPHGGPPPRGPPPGGRPPRGQHTGDEICECQQDLICTEEGICEEGVGQIDERGGAENRDGPGAGENRQGGPNPGGEGQDESSAQGGS